MAGLYLVGAWLLTQVASTLLPAFDAPSWALRGLIITLALGFIPAVIFSWVFELTPQGLRREEDVAPERSITPQTGRRMDRTIIVALVLALGYFAFDKFVLTPRREAALVASALPNESRSAINAKSIAVLPIEQPPTTDLAAFDLYSRAKSLLLMAGFSVTYGPDVRKAIELLDEAVKRDPSFFDAYCQLAYAHEYLYGQTGSDHTPARLALAEAAVQAATRLRPDAAETHLARAQYLYYGLRDY